MDNKTYKQKLAELQAYIKLTTDIYRLDRKTNLENKIGYLEAMSDVLNWMKNELSEYEIAANVTK